MKTAMKDLIFLIIFIILFSVCTNVFELKGNGYGSDVISFYNIEKNSLDAIFFGSSHSYASFSPDIIENETGLVTYNFATQQQPIYITYHYMLEALKTQHPKYFILETKMLSVDNEYTIEGVVRDALDKMKLSKNKIDAIKVSVENKKDRLSYYLNIIKYHTRYNELNKNDLIIGLTQIGLKNRGYISLPSNEEIMINNESVINITEKAKISEKNLEYLDKIVNLAEKNEIELIFVKASCQLTEDEQKKYNWLKEYAEEKNIDYIDYNKCLETLNLEIGDFYDHGHLSGTGSEKISKNFSEYLNNLKN